MAGVKFGGLRVGLAVKFNCKIKAEIVGHLVEMVAHLSGDGAVGVDLNLRRSEKL